MVWFAETVIKGNFVFMQNLFSFTAFMGTFF